MKSVILLAIAGVALADSTWTDWASSSPVAEWTSPAASPYPVSTEVWSSAAPSPYSSSVWGDWPASPASTWAAWSSATPVYTTYAPTTYTPAPVETSSSWYTSVAPATYTPPPVATYTGAANINGKPAMALLAGVVGLVALA